VHIRLLHHAVEMADGARELVFGVIADGWSHLQIAAVDQQLHPVAPKAVGMAKR